MLQCQTLLRFTLLYEQVLVVGTSTGYYGLYAFRFITTLACENAIECMCKSTKDKSLWNDLLCDTSQTPWGYTGGDVSNKQPNYTHIITTMEGILTIYHTASDVFHNMYIFPSINIIYF